MTATSLWHDIGRDENLLTKILRLAVLLVIGAVFYFFAVLPLTWRQ